MERARPGQTRRGRDTGAAQRKSSGASQRAKIAALAARLGQKIRVIMRPQSYSWGKQQNMRTRYGVDVMRSKKPRRDNAQHYDANGKFRRYLPDEVAAKSSRVVFGDPEFV